MAATENDNLIRDLPDPEASRRFLADLSRVTRTERLNEALLSDLAAIASYSPLLATTVIQNPEYITWLGRERTDTKVRSKDQLLESLSRFSLLHTGVSPNVMLARFRRRELLRIYLRDIRRLATVSEITEELSNLADTIIEFALRLAKQDLENRFGVPLEIDERGRSSPAAFCVVALGKLGSKELNYASDVDLLFFYSREGSTSDVGTSGRITNREFFIKLAEKVIALAGGQSGEGAAYRIDMRLRPRGSIGALTLSLDETVRYYEQEARAWEQQVLIRSRPVAGDIELFARFFERVEQFIFRPDVDPAESLGEVRMSKRRIEDPVPPGPGYNVKLGRGGIREIEFISQALQLAYGGRDRWLRYPHTLVSLTRLAERGAISDRQLSDLHEAYDFLRRLEHRLQMEHGLQTHAVPKGETARLLTARRMEFAGFEQFNSELDRLVQNVQASFDSIFAVDIQSYTHAKDAAEPEQQLDDVRSERETTYARIAAVSPHFADMYAANPELDTTSAPNIEPLKNLVFDDAHDLGRRLSRLRRAWSCSIVSVAMAEIDGQISMTESKELQTDLAEDSIAAAVSVMQIEIRQRYGIADLPLSVLALGKLGGRGVDYGSDLDLVLVYEDKPDLPGITSAEIYNRAVEMFVTALSGMTRDGNLYRVDLRLRPYGKNGASSNPRSVFMDYFKNTAAVWELLAFVKLRAVEGRIAGAVEMDVRRIIHDRASQTDPEILGGETFRIRHMLEKQRGGRRGVTDLKYDSGGLLDIYFASRYLQLRDNIPDDTENRSTGYVLDRLLEAGSLSAEDHEAFLAGHQFLSMLDHNIRLVTGRSRQLPRDDKSQKVVAARTGFSDIATLLETLSLYRLNIRNAFDRVLAQ